MSETTSNASAPAAGEAAPTESAEPQPESNIDWKAEAVKVRNEAAKHRTQKQEARDENTALKGQLAELSKANEGYAELKDSHHEATLKLAKITAALEAKFPAETVLDMAGRINGTTPEELLEDAKKLRGQLNTAPAKTTPRPDPTQGTPAKPALTGLAAVIQQSRTN